MFKAAYWLLPIRRKTKVQYASMSIWYDYLLNILIASEFHIADSGPYCVNTVGLAYEYCVTMVLAVWYCMSM